MKIKFAIAALALLAASPALAQTNCRVSTSAPTYASGATAPLSCDTSGNLRTGGGAITANQGTSNVSDPWYVRFATAQAVTQSGTWTVQQGGAPWSFNQTQINGVALLAGNGATGTGSQRMTIANDNSALPAWGLGAVNAAAPAGAQMQGVRSGANMVAQTQANASVAISTASAATTQLIALAASSVIHITSFDFIAGGTTNVTLVYGTGANCGTGTTSLTGAYPLTAQAGIAKGSGVGPVLVVPAGNALCVTNSAAQQVSGSVSYTQFIP